MKKFLNVFNKFPQRLTSTPQNIIFQAGFSQQQTVSVTEGEIKTVLMKTFPNSTKITVEDVSGGCGAMFNIFIESSDFQGLSVVKQHKAVYESLGDQIKKIHGLHVQTRAVK